MVRTQTMVQLSDELVETLDRVAARRGCSRSGVIRDLLWEGLGRDRDALIGEQIAAGYRRVPQGEPDDWGDIATSAASARMRSCARSTPRSGSADRVHGESRRRLVV